METAIIYLRVSTDEQKKSGLGIEAQRTACHAIAKQRGLTIIGEYVDAGISGSKDVDKRPGLTAAIAAVQRGWTLIVASRSRIARGSDIAHAIHRQVRQRQGKLLDAAGERSDDDSSSGKFVRNINDAVHQHYRDVVSEKTKEALAEKKRRGERVGSIPYGWRLAPDGKQLVASKYEQRIIALVQTLRAKGMSYRSIVKHLNINSDGLTTSRKGTPWNIQQIHRIQKLSAN